MDSRPIAAGKSSFDLVDQNRLFAQLPLANDMVMLDLACGSGAYAIAASRRLGDGARIFAVDLWKEGIETLRKEALSQGITNISAFVADVSKYIPVEDRSVDVCLAATVLHDLVEDGTDKGALREIRRVLKPGATLAVVEFKKQEGPPGPPLAVRLSPEELEGLVVCHGFQPSGSWATGPHTYLSLFKSA